MARVNFRAVEDRFTHIDATLVRGSATFGAGGLADATVTVNFYPWWEHPAYLEARATDSPWGFTGTVGRDVTVRAIAPVAARLGACTNVIDWAFTDDHPLLWDFGPTAMLYINGPFTADALITRILARRIPFVQRGDLHRFFSPTRAPVASCAVHLPAVLLPIVEAELAALNVPTFLPQAPAPASSPRVLLLLDGDDYIVASDFKLDVPEFTHDPAWFAPRS